MEIYYKFKSVKDYKSISIDWHYTTLADLKRNIYYKNSSGKRITHYKDNLIVTNAQTNEEYLDGETLIPKNTSVIIRRVPWPRCMPIVITPDADQDKPLASIDTPAMDWQCNNPDFFGAHRGFERGTGGRSDSRGFGRGGLLERMTPPPGYICHRCKVPGHFIQHCPTNGDPTFDIKRTKPLTGIPKSMLMATPDGSYALLSGGGAVLKPNEAAFEKEIEGMPSTCSVADLPAELYCPLCRKVMKDAVLASKCCFKSFCDKCIRDYIISKSLCFCGATSVLADYLLPNNTLRATIVRILESNNSSGANSGSPFQPQDMESARCPQPKIPCPNVPSSTLSATSKEDGLVRKNKGNTKVVEITEPVTIDNNTQKILDMVTVEKSAEVSETAQACARETGSQMCPAVTDEEMQQKQVSGGVGKKKKKEGPNLQSRSDQDFAAENYLLPVEPFGYSPYWNSMQPEIDVQRPHGGQMPFMGYGLGPASIPFGGAFYHDPIGAQVYMPFPPQRDLAKHGTDFNVGGGRDMISHEDVPSAKSKTKFITPDSRQPRLRSGRWSPDHITQVPEHLLSSSKRKVKYEHPHQHGEREHRHWYRSESVSVSSKSLTKKTISDHKHNASVFSHITSPGEESAASKKRKLDSSSPSAVNGSSHRSQRTTSYRYHEDHRKNAAAEQDYESSDDDRHFKRRRSSPSPVVKEGRHSRRGSRAKEVIAASIGTLHVY